MLISSANSEPPLEQSILTLSGQVQQVRLHVLDFVSYDVAVELKHCQDVLAESGGGGVV